MLRTELITADGVRIEARYDPPSPRPAPPAASTPGTASAPGTASVPGTALASHGGTASHGGAAPGAASAPNAVSAPGAAASASGTAASAAASAAYGTAGTATASVTGVPGVTGAAGPGARADTPSIPDAAPDPAQTPALVLAHGFTGSLDRPAVRRAAAAFTAHGAVITFSFRGHGGSGGRSTVGDREVLDLAAAVAWARRLGHDRVATVGFSMGGSVVLRHGALHRRPEPTATTETPVAADADTAEAATTADADADVTAGTDDTADGDVATEVTDTATEVTDATDGPTPSTAADAVVAVSAPARWFYRGTAPMRRLHWAVQHPLGRVVSRLGLRTRIHPHDWDPVPLSPVAAAPLLAPVPLLVVHGDSDPYFPLDHPCSLAEAAGPDSCELWIERGFGHAENAAGPELLHRIGDWLVTRLGAGTARPSPGTGDGPDGGEKTARAHAPGARRHHGSRAADGPARPRDAGTTAGTQGTDG